jgi:hypothetical protein
MSTPTPSRLVSLTIDTGDADRARRLVAAIEDHTPADDAGDHLTIHLPSGPWGAAITDCAVYDTAVTPTYHGLVYAECFGCGYGTANPTTLEAWNDLTGECPSCDKPGRILWVNKGGTVVVTESDDMGMVSFSTLRQGTKDNTPPDAPGTITGPELDADDPDVCEDGCGLDLDHEKPCRERPGGRILPLSPLFPDDGPCFTAGAHLPATRHHHSDCRA